MEYNKFVIIFVLSITNKAGGNSNNTAKIKMKNLLQKQQTLSSMVDSMSNFKNEGSKRGKEIYEDYKVRVGKLIEELRAEGVSEEKHPIFRDAVTSYNYWK